MKALYRIHAYVLLIGLAPAVGFIVGLTDLVSAESKTEKPFTAVVTDIQGIETEVKNLIFYWEEKVSETAFVPHELKQLPVKRGNTTVYLRFDNLKQIEAKAGADKGSQTFTVTLANGKTGEFTPAIAGSFKGESDFGQVELPLQTLAKVVFK